MIGITSKITLNPERLKNAVDRASKRVFSIAGFAIRKTAIASIERAVGPSEPGTPPHTHRKNYLRRAIIYDATKEGAVIGPRFSAVGTSASAHEFGGEYRGGTYPERPFMGPALEENTDSFANAWKGSIGE